jgi:hypothetical protein
MIELEKHKNEIEDPQEHFNDLSGLCAKASNN